MSWDYQGSAFDFQIWKEQSERCKLRIAHYDIRHGAKGLACYHNVLDIQLLWGNSLLGLASRDSETAIAFRIWFTKLVTFAEVTWWRSDNVNCVAVTCLEF